MTVIRTSIRIERPIEAVFAYATTPAHWPRWHPASRAVSGASDHPLELGEHVEEHFRVVGREGQIVWTVSERQPPTRWAITGSLAPGTTTTISYTLSAEPDGSTMFLRELTFQADFPPGVWSETGPLIEQESAVALRRLKSVIEATL